MFLSQSLPNVKKPRMVRRLSTPINLKEDLKPFTTEELVDIIDILVCTNPEIEKVSNSPTPKCPQRNHDILNAIDSFVA